jgi:hypothetical protein
VVAGKKPPEPSVVLPFIFTSLALIITAGVPGESKTKRTKAFSLGVSTAIDLNGAFSQANTVRHNKKIGILNLK